MPFRVRCGSCDGVYYSGQGHVCVEPEPIAPLVRLATAKKVSNPRLESEVVRAAVEKVEQEKRVAADARKAKKAARGKPAKRSPENRSGA